MDESLEYKQYLYWATSSDEKYDDDMKSWPKMYRKAASQAIERLKDKLRETYKEVKFVSQTSSCKWREEDGKYELLLTVVVECL